MTPQEKKASLRVLTLAKRDALTPTQKAAHGQTLLHHAINTLNVPAGTMLAGFWPIRSEPDIRPMLAHFQGLGVHLCLPAVIDLETIVFRQWVGGSALHPAGFGTMSPGADAPVVDPDVLLMPLSAFDRRGNRIGYGAGHYDRAIYKLHQKGRLPRLIGIAFDVQEVPSVPAEPHDVALSAILTESGLRNFVKGNQAENAASLSG